MEWLIIIVLCLTVIALSGIGVGLVDVRRRHNLELRKEERRMVEAQTKQLEARNRQTELEYQSALAELERFDRRGPGAETGTGVGDTAGPLAQLPAGQEAAEEPSDPA